MSSRGDQTRRRIAAEAARVMAEGGIRDYQMAKRKALDRLGLDAATRQLPRNDEIEQALEVYLRLFRGESRERRLVELRSAAVQAMRFLDRFRPRLVGPVLSGVADEHSEVCLHVFADPAEEVALFLIEHGVDHRQGERRLRVGGNGTCRVPVCRFVAGDVPIELVIFDEAAKRRRPLSPVDGRPMRRATLAEVETLAGAGD